MPRRTPGTPPTGRPSAGAALSLAAPATVRSRGAALVAAAAMVLAACGGGSGDETGASADRAAAPPTRPAGAVPQPTGANPEDSTVPPRDTPAEKSQPWWKTVRAFSGDGSTTTETFDIGEGALQWRVTWTCSGGTFTAVPVKDGNEPLRPLASGASCSATDGSGFSAQAGRFALKITAAGAWTATVEEQVDEPLVEAPMAEMTQGSVVSTATLYDVDRTVRGTARIYRLPDGRHAVRLEDFFVTANIDLELRLSELAAPRTTDEAVKAPFARVSFLKATLGSMNYLIPPEIDLSRYKSVVIWCEITHNAYGAGTLSTS